MSQAAISLPEVDQVKVTLIVDNSVDLLLADSEVAKRFPRGPHSFEQSLPLAEHGFSALIRVSQGSQEGTVLLDAGFSRQALLHNLDVLGVDAVDIQAIVLSHGHADHTMGLTGLLERLGERNVRLVLHPDAYLERKTVVPSGAENYLPPLRKADLQRENVVIAEEAGPSMLVDGMLLVSGQVARTTDFETGVADHYAKRDGAWEPDRLIMDDQCVIAHVRGKGLVIVTGCGHAGIINIIRHAQRLTGVEPVYAVLGGFHLSGRLFEPIIPATTAALQDIAPRYMMPGHCTGWSATHQIAQALPEAFIPSSVGTTLVLQGTSEELLAQATDENQHREIDTGSPTGNEA